MPGTFDPLDPTALEGSVADKVIGGELPQENHSADQKVLEQGHAICSRGGLRVGHWLLVETEHLTRASQLFIRSW